MTSIALALVGVYVLVAFGLRSWIQYRRTGDTGFRGLSGAPGSAEWTGGVLFVVASLMTFGAPVAATLGLDPLDALVRPALQVIGVVAAVLGIAGTLISQLSMGSSWRIGVDAGERTDLVTDGVFALVRNPIYTAMLLAAAGLLLMVPNALAISGLLALVLALELQVRAVEEPHLARVHGEAWNSYAARVGRFIPWTGRRRQPQRPARP